MRQRGLRRPGSARRRRPSRATRSRGCFKSQARPSRRVASSTHQPGSCYPRLASPVRRKILAYLAHAELSAGEIAARFDLSKPSISQHLAILEGAGLVAGEKRGQFVIYRQVEGTLMNSLAGFMQEACPVARPLRRERKARAKAASEASG